MPMKMGWRWYGEGNDPISLSDTKQIPGVTSIVWALHDKMPGEIWEIDEIQKVADQIHGNWRDFSERLYKNTWKKSGGGYCRGYAVEK